MSTAPHLTLAGVCVDFPVFSSQSRGLINTLLRYGRRSQDRIDASGLGGVRVRALRDIDLRLDEGDRLALIGRNGAGKTTLLRVLSGVYEPSAGSIVSAGRISAMTDLTLGMDPEGNGYDFIVTRGIVMGLTRVEARALIPQVEEFADLGNYLHLPVRAYSSGMMLRLAFAVATSVTPDILLMDEMIGVGDAQFIEKARRRLEKMMGDVKILVLASHNEQILRTFCTRALLLTEGTIAFCGTVDDCLEHYLGSTTAVAQPDPG